MSLAHEVRWGLVVNAGGRARVPSYTTVAMLDMSTPRTAVAALWRWLVAGLLRREEAFPARTY